MAVLELANCDDVTLELRSASNVLQSVAARQREDQLLAARDDRQVCGAGAAPPPVVAP
jgi:hypothetical protein